MSQLSSRRFCSSLEKSHYYHLGGQKAKLNRVRVGFLLLDHFSMANFTVAVDVLVTSNLIHENQAFEYITIGLDKPIVKSDLGIEINTTLLLSEEKNDELLSLDIVIICGGFRSDLSYSQRIVKFIRQQHSKGAYLIGLWNGSVFFAQAGLVDHQSIAIHPDNHPFIKECFKTVSVSPDSYAIYENCLSSTGVISTLRLLLHVLELLHGESLAKAVGEILHFEQLKNVQSASIVKPKRESVSSEVLENILILMENNIEEPLSMQELVKYAQLSRRKIERLFQQYLNTSPVRYYIELRVGYAKCLLQQTQKSITEIALASGFVSASHFSRCYKSYFGVSPIQFRNLLA
ncbi:MULTISPECIES: GlxA family transcriptional regulator [Marinomonas]|uniref:Helix-turn-helix domain-containing protein n=1 Tax=Marinomonas rhodophyticola TaxID=2992803 RepID=A0ABT3KGY4_9GAMM|nr:helix-turn-helix domain-containing protein [Marinomonas sp. KJ51-3]MCW4629800.1 helix-turn-helix domain-containing protein [Marinomonas sp. KJ51-3]